MAGFKTVIVGADSRDLGEYERLAALVRAKGLKVMACGGLAEQTSEQFYDTNDSWLRFPSLNAGLFKFVETGLISGIFSRAHIEKNANLIAAKSKILAKHGLKGAVHFLEPQILPERFYQARPDLRGPRCDNPCVALSRYYAPCIDHPDVLAHYREGFARLLEIAPELGVIDIWTDDCGGGICWCTGLYPGKNGPEACKDVPMGERIRAFLSAVLAGAKDAGRKVEVVFRPYHFGRDEVYDVIRRMPKGTRPSFDTGLYPSTPFIDREHLDYLEKAKEAGRAGVLLGDPTLSYPLSPVAEAPIPFFILERLREASQSGAGGMWVGGVSAPRDGVEPTNAMALFSGLKKPPRDGADVARRVAGIAKAQVGAAFADSVLSAWQDVDRALALWPNVADTNHLLYPFYSVLGDRWLVRPLVPAPQMLTDEERAYYSKERHLSRNREHLDSFFVAEGTVNYKVDEFRWLVAIYEHMMKYMDRAARTLEGRFAELEAAEDGVRERFMLAYRRVAALRAIWRTQRNVLRCGSTIEYFTGPRKDEFWHVIRKDESYLEPGTHRRLFLEAMDDEIANAREIIRLVAESKETLIWTGDVEQSFVLPRDFTRQLEKKIEVMEKHKADIDALFPDCPPETFTDPTYEWADKTLGKGEGER